MTQPKSGCIEHKENEGLARVILASPPIGVNMVCIFFSLVCVG